MLETELRPCTILDDEVPEADMVTLFEDCRNIPKVEFQSKALELVYDSAELTKRLNSPGMSVVCLKVCIWRIYILPISSPGF